ncbi:hypothetical protein BJ546DRAFT_529204 [Cryomyces antarcticus]
MPRPSKVAAWHALVFPTAQQRDVQVKGIPCKLHNPSSPLVRRLSGRSGRSKSQHGSTPVIRASRYRTPSGSSPVLCSGEAHVLRFTPGYSRATVPHVSHVSQSRLWSHHVEGAVRGQYEREEDRVPDWTQRRPPPFLPSWCNRSFPRLPDSRASANTSSSNHTPQSCTPQACMFRSISISCCSFQISNHAAHPLLSHHVHTAPTFVHI